MDPVLNSNTLSNNPFDFIGHIDQYIPILMDKINTLAGNNIVIVIQFILIALSLIFIVCIVYIGIKTVEKIHELHKTFHPPHKHDDHGHASHEGKRVPKSGAMRETWETVARHMASNNPADWKLSILEADSILDELTKTLNLPGETLGERLKSVDSTVMKTIQYAWEAHKARNRIAHEGIKAQISRDEAVMILGQFERVFREFDYI